jgi:hypothetical protein
VRETPLRLTSAHLVRSTCWLYPVEHIYGLGLVVVEASDLLCEQRDEEGTQVEVAIEQAELLEDDLGAFEPFGAFVFGKLLLQVAGDFVAGDELALDAVDDGQL